MELFNTATALRLSSMNITGFTAAAHSTYDEVRYIYQLELHVSKLIVGAGLVVKQATPMLNHSINTKSMRII